MANSADDEWVYPMIEELKKRPQIWDPKHADYKNNSMKKKAWEQLATVVANICGIEKTGKCDCF
jgi:hypothetical protein